MQGDERVKRKEFFKGVEWAYTKGSLILLE